MKSTLLCLCLLLVVSGCAFTHIEEKRPDGTFYTMDSKVISVPDGFLSGVLSLAGDLLKKQPTVKPPVTPPVVPPVIEDPDPITDPVPPVNPPYKFGKIESLSGTGFVWKPVAENPPNGLVVLTPASWGVATCQVFAADGVTLIETATYSGPTNPDRPTYRFSKPGGSFPANCILSVGQRKYLVPDPAKRYD